MFKFSKSILFVNFNKLMNTNKFNVSNYKRPLSIYLEDEHTHLLQSEFNNNEVLTVDKWKSLRLKILQSNRINDKTIDATIVGHCLRELKLTMAKSYMEFLNFEKININAACYGRLLKLYYGIGQERDLSIDECKEVIEMYDLLLLKNPILDPSTAENVIHALCVTSDWNKSLGIFDNIKLTSQPTASTYGAIVVSAFKNNELNVGIKFLEEMIQCEKSPKCEVFMAWMDYNIRNNLPIDDMLNFIGENEILISSKVALHFKEQLTTQKIKCVIASLYKSHGVCTNCNKPMKNISISKEEFNHLCSSFLEKVLIRKNVFLKSTPEELTRFEKFIEKTAPYDCVIDGLNVAFSTGLKKSPVVHAKLLAAVVKYFKQQDKNVLVLGRKHMNKWPFEQMNFIRKNSSIFLTEDLSQDDPYLLYAALKSGPNTDIFSRDLMRSHAFLLGNELKVIFRRWQHQHQHTLIHATEYGKIVVKEPLKFNSFAHQTENIWHVPFVENHLKNRSEQMDLSKDWLCITK